MRIKKQRKPTLRGPIMNEKPLFSVCIEVKNREHTLEKVFDRLEKQKFRNFEVVIFDNNSQDSSLKMIKKFKKKKHGFNVKVIESSKTLPDIAAWNVPLMNSSGEFIAICEGDDYFAPNHLLDAGEFLNHSELGLYIAGSKLRELTLPRIVPSKDLITSLRLFQWCPPPSTFIFRRLDKQGNPFFFDEKHCWAAEYSLLNDVLNEYQFAFENYSSNYIERGFRFYLKNSFHMQDMLLFKTKNLAYYDEKQLKRVNNAISMRAWQLFWLGIMNTRFDAKLVQIFFSHFNVSRFTLQNMVIILLKTFRSEISRKLIR
jgi:glycosyltransferase involved in cell wall biosynthesis